ncbi:MAG: ECF-type sigma factor [Pirellulales bacterium]
MSKVTQILSRLDAGDPAAAAELLPLVYDELRKLAAAKLSCERPGQTLQATSLVHEAYLRLVEDGASQWHGRAHFFGAAAEAMRRILVDAARSKGRSKRGGSWKRLELEQAAPQTAPPPVDLLDLNDALDELASAEPMKAELVKLRYFAGFTLVEAAKLLGISGATADRHWKYARAWLSARLRDPDLELQEPPPEK